MNDKLNCSADKCVHNMNGLCGANNISITGTEAQSIAGTACDTFQEKGFKNAISNLGNMNITGGIKQMFNGTQVEMSPRIRCEAIHCVYNQGQMCNANFVQVTGPGANSSVAVKCSTFTQ